MICLAQSGFLDIVFLRGFFWGMFVRRLITHIGTGRYQQASFNPPRRPVDPWQCRLKWLPPVQYLGHLAFRPIHVNGHKYCLIIPLHNYINELASQTTSQMLLNRLKWREDYTSGLTATGNYTVPPFTAVKAGAKIFSSS